MNVSAFIHGDDKASAHWQNSTLDDRLGFVRVAINDRCKIDIHWMDQQSGEWLGEQLRKIGEGIERYYVEINENDATAAIADPISVLADDGCPHAD